MERAVGVDLPVGVQVKVTVTVTENGSRSGCYETLDIIRYVSRYHQAQPHRHQMSLRLRDNWCLRSDRCFLRGNLIHTAIFATPVPHLLYITLYHII